MRVLEAFSPKDIRTCSRLLRKAGRAGMGAEGLVEFADYLTEIAAKISRGEWKVVGQRKKHRRTLEEVATRKDWLAKTKFGKVPIKP